MPRKREILSAAKNPRLNLTAYAPTCHSERSEESPFELDNLWYDSIAKVTEETQ